MTAAVLEEQTPESALQHRDLRRFGGLAWWVLRCRQVV
jgi:hypothetical protein